MGLDRPLLVQFVRWFGAVLSGDLGHSLFLNASVSELFLQHLAPTLALALYAQAIALVLGLASGVISAWQHGRFADRAIRALATFGMSVPGFLLGLFLIFFFAVQLRWFPVVGYRSTNDDWLQNVWYLTLPAIALGFRIAALISRMTRAVMLDVLQENFINTARAKGVPERTVLLRHTLKNALIPVLTICGESFASLVTGTIVIESVFGIPGVGSLIVDSIERRVPRRTSGQTAPAAAGRGPSAGAGWRYPAGWRRCRGSPSPDRPARDAPGRTPPARRRTAPAAAP